MLGSQAPPGPRILSLKSVSPPTPGALGRQGQTLTSHPNLGSSIGSTPDKLCAIGVS